VKTSTPPVRLAREKVFSIFRRASSECFSGAVSGLLDRADRSSSEAAQRRAEGAELDGESAKGASACCPALAPDNPDRAPNTLPLVY
jgi:hypothetical protein